MSRDPEIYRTLGAHPHTGSGWCLLLILAQSNRQLHPLRVCSFYCIKNFETPPATNSTADRVWPRAAFPLTVILVAVTPLVWVVPSCTMLSYTSDVGHLISTPCGETAGCHPWEQREGDQERYQGDPCSERGSQLLFCILAVLRGVANPADCHACTQHTHPALLWAEIK